MDILGDFLFLLYRAARECEVELFQSSVLDWLQRHVDFTSALWGAGRFVGPGDRMVPTALHTKEIDPTFLVEWSRVQNQDPIVSVLRSTLGVAMDVRVPNFYAPTPALVEFARGYGIQSMTVISASLGRPDRLGFLSLYRPLPDTVSSPEEKRWLEAIAPHLAQSSMINRALHLSDAAATDSTDGFVAVADAQTGRLLCMDDAFAKHMSGEWTSFDGRSAPKTVIAAWREAGCFTHVARHCSIDGRRTGELVYLTLRTKTRVESLTPRQEEIARLYVQGLSNKQIALQVRLSPATVRNHLAAIYAAVGVHGKLELARALHRPRSGA